MINIRENDRGLFDVILTSFDRPPVKLTDFLTQKSAEEYIKYINKKEKSCAGA